MNKLTTEQDALSTYVRVPGCHFTEMGMIFDVVDLATLNEASKCLQRFNKGEEWCWGDILMNYAELRLMQDFTAEQLRGMSDEDKEEERLRYVRSHGSVVMGDELADTQYQRYIVASFYNRLMRIRELTPWHHRVAMDGQRYGDMAVAQDWLDKAKANGWSGNELRSEMRNAKKGTLNDPPANVQSLQHELFGACRWAMATTKRVPEMELEEVRRTRANLKPLLALDQSLADAEQRLAGVAKESLSAAA